MIEPSTTKFSEENGINKYELVIATAKCARMITDDFIKQVDKVAEKKEEEIMAI